MKLFGTIITIFALLVLLASPAEGRKDWQHKCVKKSPAVVNAISKYCTQAGLKSMVPTKWTSAGKSTDRNDPYYHSVANVHIAGNCEPKQWVPRKMCFLQFYRMCARGNDKGQNLKRFGRDGCQSWSTWNPYPHPSP
ncbi:hypothetical protein LTR37_014811 [Vermiconidia calcicola]|uniref:Uncharacterized protein n=1 Tax=Vermiconidia calcicola TaxID=1690605 RepID=A0ACC3MSQ1_9PEZI|nr:hypothetical protein LTR37_014811 [Vermiconidia calcicola]